MANDSMIRDGIRVGEVRAYYMGDQDENLESKMITSLESTGYKFRSMAHTKPGVHRLLFLKDEFTEE